MPAIQGLRGTGQFTTDFRPTNYRELFTLMEPNGTAPLQALLAMAGSESTDDPKYNHFRDQLPDRKLSANAAVASAVTTAVTVDVVDDINLVVAGTVLTNMDTSEVMRVTAVNYGTGALTVERNIGGTTHQIADNANIIISGFADQEGGNSPAAMGFDATVDYNYTQIFKQAVEITGTLQQTHLRTGNKEQEQLMKGLKLHMGDIERSMFFGRRAIVNENTANPTRYTGGLINSIPNVIDVASGFTTPNVMTEKEFDRTLVEEIFAYGATEKVVFAGARAVANLQEIAKNRWQPTAVDGAYGVSMSRYSTFAGDLLVQLHPMFRQVPGMSDAMVILDMSEIKYRYMQNRDTHLERDIEANDFDGSKHQYVTECGFELLQGLPHTYLKGWNAVS